MYSVIIFETLQKSKVHLFLWMLEQRVRLERAVSLVPNDALVIPGPPTHTPAREQSPQPEPCRTGLDREGP